MLHKFFQKIVKKEILLTHFKNHDWFDTQTTQRLYKKTAK